MSQEPGSKGGTGSKDGAAVRIPPPVIFLLSILSGVGLGSVAPLPLPLAEGSLSLMVGAVPGLLGVLCLGASLAHFRRTRQKPEPWKPTPELIVSGIYLYTRNPMYVGMGLLQTGIGIGLANAWILLLTCASLFGVYLTAIRPEEAYLESKFGDSYLSYKKSVARWLGPRSPGRS